MTTDTTKSSERTALEKELKDTIKDVVQEPFDLESGVTYLADFVEEFKLQKAIKKGKWTWGEMEYSPSALSHAGLLMILENEIATVRLGFANIGYNKDKKSVNAEIAVIPKDPESAISIMTLGYATEMDGSKCNGSFVIRSKEKHIAFTIINFMKFPPYSKKISVSNSNPATPSELKKWISSINSGDAWERCSEFIMQASGFETGQ